MLKAKNVIDMKYSFSFVLYNFSFHELGLCFLRALRFSVLLCLLIGAVLTFVFRRAVGVVRFCLLIWSLLRVSVALYVVTVSQSAFLSCALKDGKELLAEVLLLILGLLVKINRTLFWGLSSRSCTSVLHLLANEVDLFICPACLGLLLSSLLVLFFLIILLLLSLSFCFLCHLDLIFKLDDSLSVYFLTILLKFGIEEVPCFTKEVQLVFDFAKDLDDVGVWVILDTQWC